MPRGKKPTGKAEAEGSPPSMKDLVEKERRIERQQQAEEHKELLQAISGLMKKRSKTSRSLGSGDTSGEGSTVPSDDESVDDSEDEGDGICGKEPVLTRFIETEMDIEHFLTGFEQVATAYKWQRELWVLKLAPLLIGRA